MKSTKGLTFKRINDFFSEKEDLVQRTITKNAIFEFQSLTLDDCCVIYHCEQNTGFIIEFVGYFGVMNENWEKEVVMQRLLTFDQLFDVACGAVSITIHCLDDGSHETVYYTKFKGMD